MYLWFYEIVMKQHCLSNALLDPVPRDDQLDAPFWAAAAESRLVVQRCAACSTWRWAPEWICYHCYSPDFSFEEVEPTGVLESWERVWYPAHPLLKDSLPYTVVLVAIAQAGNIRMIGNYSGDSEDDLVIGCSMSVVFEQHRRPDHSHYSLIQWRSLVD
jgi:uncharacterized OB-fold protein